MSTANTIEVQIDLPPDWANGLTDEQRSEVVRLAEEAMAEKAAEIRNRHCPDWCSRDPRTHVPGQPPTHMTDIGGVGVGINQCAADGPTVWVPSGASGETVSVVFARQLAADLVAAADLLEGVSS